MGSQLALKSRIRSTESLAKIFNAQEMIASSHIAKARDVALNAKPYTDAIFDAVQALVAHTHITHPIAVKDEKNPRVAVLALTSDRGMAGPYTSSIIRETESLLSRLDAAGKQPELFVYGRRGSTYYKYRNRDIAATWEGDTDQPGVEIAETISNTLMDAYMKPAEKGGVSELYIVYTEFINMVVQKVRVLRMLPVEIVKNETKAITMREPFSRNDIRQPIMRQIGSDHRHMPRHEWHESIPRHELSTSLTDKMNFDLWMIMPFGQRARIPVA